MLRPYDLLENVLIDIEKGLKEGINTDILAEKYSLSEGHLRRLFRFAFSQPLPGYINLRRLTASIDELLKTDSKIIDVALDFGFDYEQSYIRAFKREFGVTPGELRKTGQIVKITPSLHLFNSNRLGDGLIFGPEIVMVPQFHVVGKRHKVPFHKILTMDMPIAKQFFYNERQNIQNAVNPDTLIYLCIGDDTGENCINLMPSLQVESYDFIPEEYSHYTFPTSLCANFRFIGCNFDEINMHAADDMFKVIDDFNASEDQKYFINRGLNIDKFDLSNKNESYCQWEWFAPVIEKSSVNIPMFNPSGIKKVYKQELPALRFIGRKCVETSIEALSTLNVLNLLDNWQLNDWFNDIEKLQEDGSPNCGAYIYFVRKRETGIFEHWMGMFTPENTNAPEGYESIDFPKMTISVIQVYDKRDAIINYETECRNKLTEEDFALKNDQWYFRRFNWRGFFYTDIYGKRLLDYCYPVK